MVEDNYGKDFIINYGIVLILPTEYDRVLEVSENEEDFTIYEAADEKHLCYYVMNSGVVKEQKFVDDTQICDISGLIYTKYFSYFSLN